jgi:hypothetical protein
MSSQIWTPGMAGPLDEFVARLARMVGAFAQEHDLEQAEVRIELVDGSRHVLATATAEPGFGFFSFTPHPQDPRDPRRVIIPIGAVKTIEISTPDPASQFGFAVSE